MFADRAHKAFFNGGALYVDPGNPAYDPAYPERNVPAARYAELVDDRELRAHVFGRIIAEREATIAALLDITQSETLLADNPLLTRSIENRFPYIDPLNHLQVELLKAYRGKSDNPKVLRGLQLTINGISAGLRNSG